MGNKKIKLDNCVNCRREFTDVVKNFCKNKCQHCYFSERSGTNSLPKEVKVESCIKCGRKPGDLDSKGRPLANLVKGLCRKHYNSFYLQSACDICKSCGLKFKSPRLSCLCSMCKPVKEHQPKKVKKMKSGLLIKRRDIPQETLQTMLTLFRRYKNGTQSPIDHFRVVDVFLDVFAGHPFVYNSMLDSYNEESQVVAMLRELKKIYDNN